MIKKIILFFVFIDLVLLVLIFKKFRLKNKLTSINKISKEEIISNVDSNLEFYFEPVGWGKKENILWLESKPKYFINSDTLNSYKDYYVEKSDEVYRIIALGDSFTFGLYVNTEDNWVSKLEELFNKKLPCKNITKFEVINLGVPGYDLELSAERYRLRGQKYNPDLIIWLLDNNDFEEIYRYINPIYLKIYNEYGKDINKTGTSYIYPKLKEAATEFSASYGKENIEIYQKNILEGFIDSYHKKILIFDYQYLESNYENIIKSLVKKYQNLFFVNSSFTRFDFNKHTFQPYDGHPNKEGHIIIAEDLYKYLIENIIVNCQQ